MGVNGHLRQAFRLAQPADRLAYQQPPTVQASMLPGGDHIAFYAGEEHRQTSKDQHPTSRETANPKFQIPNASQAPKSRTAPRKDLVFGSGSFSGAWSLELGAFINRYADYPPSHIAS